MAVDVRGHVREVRDPRRRARAIFQRGLGHARRQLRVVPEMDLRVQRARVQRILFQNRREELISDLRFLEIEIGEMLAHQRVRLKRPGFDVIDLAHGGREILPPRGYARVALQLAVGVQGPPLVLVRSTVGVAAPDLKFAA